jgi:hypothetical protein
MLLLLASRLHCKRDGGELRFRIYFSVLIIFSKANRVPLRGGFHLSLQHLPTFRADPVMIGSTIHCTMDQADRYMFCNKKKTILSMLLTVVQEYFIDIWYILICVLLHNGNHIPGNNFIDCPGGLVVRVAFILGLT